MGTAADYKSVSLSFDSTDEKSVGSAGSNPAGVLTFCHASESLRLGQFSASASDGLLILD